MFRIPITQGGHWIEVSPTDKVRKVNITFYPYIRSMPDKDMKHMWCNHPTIYTATNITKPPWFVKNNVAYIVWLYSKSLYFRSALWSIDYRPKHGKLYPWHHSDGEKWSALISLKWNFHLKRYCTGWKRYLCDKSLILLNNFRKCTRRRHQRRFCFIHWRHL